MHADTHVYIYVRTGTDVDADTHTDSNTDTHTLMHTRTHTLMNTDNDVAEERMGLGKFVFLTSFVSQTLYIYVIYNVL